jgi:predicted O-methyltransferase YrrM
MCEAAMNWSTHTLFLNDMIGCLMQTLPGAMNTIESQLHPVERRILSRRVKTLSDAVILEVGTYKGGGSTLTFLEALKRNSSGKLIGIEADPDVFAQMKANIASVDRRLFDFFEPISGFSQDVIPKLLTEYPHFDLAFLDGGNNPREQIEEFELLKDAIPVGGFLFSHDANLRKGHWLVPYLSELDNWRVTIHQASEEGLLEAEKIRTNPSPASSQRARKILWGKMLSPVELSTLLFPSSFKGFVLKLLPLKIRRRIGEGRK